MGLIINNKFMEYSYSVPYFKVFIADSVYSYVEVEILPDGNELENMILDYI